MSSVWRGGVRYVRCRRQPIFGHCTHDRRTVGPARHDRITYTHTGARAFIHTHTHITRTHNLADVRRAARHTAVAVSRRRKIGLRFTHTHTRRRTDERRQSAGVLVAARQSSTDVISRTDDNGGNRRRRQRWQVRCRSHSRFLPSSANRDKQ